MFSYNRNIKEKELFVSMPLEIRYDYRFLNEITDLMKKVEASECDKIYFSIGKGDINFDKLSSAYLLNTLLFFARKKAVMISRSLRQLFDDQVTRHDGARFEKIDIKEVVSSKCQQCYIIGDTKSVNQTVQILGEFITGHNLFFKDAKEFLITTIGEIFANAFGHSNEKEVSFMYDIENNKDKIYLVINITDYGKTIVHNVQVYQKELFAKKLSSKECIVWAMGFGNTTKSGSGGYGLPTLKDYVSNVKGELLIFSGDSIYALNGETENILQSKGDFYGTSISMKIPLFVTSKAILYDENSKKIISIDLDKI